MVSPTLCPPYCSGDSDVMDVPVATDGIASQMPLFQSRVHPCCLVLICLMEQCVGDGEVVLSTETQQHEAVLSFASQCHEVLVRLSSCCSGTHSGIEVSQQDALVAWGDIFHESIEFLTERASSLLVRVGAYALMTVTCREELSGKWSFINCSLTGVGRSGSCLQSEVLMASPTPCILSSSFAFPLQKNVYPSFGSAMEPSLASLVSH